MAKTVATVRISNIPLTAIASELFDFLESSIGNSTVFACEIATERKTWKSRGSGRVQFQTLEAADRAILLSCNRDLKFHLSYLEVLPSSEDIIVRPIEARNRLSGGVLHVGFLAGEGLFSEIERWALSKVELMPERKRVDFWVEDSGESYKLEIQFGDLVGAFGCNLNQGKSTAILLQLKYAPRIYHKISGPTITPKLRTDRYHLCKEDYEFVWVRTTDFSAIKSIGQSTYLCWELAGGLSASQVLNSFPLSKEFGDLNVAQVKPFCWSPADGSELVPILNYHSFTLLSYEILFQLNSLVHAQKLIAPTVDPDLLNILCGLTEETAIKILLKLHKLKSTCYEPIQFVQTQLYSIRKKQKGPPDPSKSVLTDKHLMRCYRVLVTPTKVYFMGPELEISNYVLQHFSAYASDFIRVSFVDEDWSKLHPDAISTRTDHGLLSKPYRTRIHKRVLSILKSGIVVGAKRFEFLAFSASQLRSNSIWMFASNQNLTAENIREWMGSFNSIRSVSKCAARMGQLFSSSILTMNVPVQDVQIIPDIDLTTDGIKYCFSDGIGKISLSFARLVAQKCGLSHTPSAFQIRYGGYKGVVAVDRTSFRKLSLRRSMLKFDSKNSMLCVTKWSESVPCYLNREIVSLMSTLGIADEVFCSMQREQLNLLGEMLSDRAVALNVLENMVGGDAKLVLVKMLLHGYEPNVEPYLSMMLRAHWEFQLSDIRGRCRIFVPKGRVLFGCLDETGSLSYGQVYIRVTMTKAEREANVESKSFIRNVDRTTSTIVGKLVVTKNPCLHPGDIRVLEAIYEPELEEMGLIDCLVFPQTGERPHPNECSGGDLDGDLYFVCWEENLIPLHTDKPMDYIGRRARNMDHEVRLEEIHKFFIDYMVNDVLGVISTAHLVHADREPLKARSEKCLHLATLHSMAVDFAKTGAPAEMPRVLKPREYPDFLERGDRPMYPSPGVLGKLYRASFDPANTQSSQLFWSKEVVELTYDSDLEVTGFKDFLEDAECYKMLYIEKLTTLMTYYGAESEDEILTGNLRKAPISLNRDKKKYGEMKDRILIAIKSLQKEVLGWFKDECKGHEQSKMASAWYYVTYHPDYRGKVKFLSFPWILSDVLLNIKSSKEIRTKQEG